MEYKVSGYIDYYGKFYEVPHLQHDYYFMDVYREFCRNYNLSVMIDEDNTHDDFLINKGFCKATWSLYENCQLFITSKQGLSEYQNSLIKKLMKDDKYKVEEIYI